jgi:hypothetical protein
VLRRWIETGGITEVTPLFRPSVNAAGLGIARLTDGSIARIVKAPHEFAGDSLRAGMMTSAGENGVAELADPAYIEAQVGCAPAVHQAGRKAPAFADQRHRLVVD